MTRKNKKRKEEICEDYCFSCKDGGLLIICDYKNCLKAYHPECVEKDDTFLDSGEHWSCRWHYCFICQKLAKFYCFCCPQAICGRCIYDAEFVLVRGKKGFCQQCLKLALLIENGSPLDSDGASVDFKDEDTYEFFFNVYWEYLKNKEGLTRECVCFANDLLKKGKNYRFDSYFLETGEIEENIGDSEEESHCIVSDYDDLEEFYKHKSSKKRSKTKRKLCGTSMKGKSKKKEFVGWASKSLLAFLASINNDTSKSLAEYEVVSIVMDYCKKNKLFDPEKKKRILCDETLRSLFGRKFLLKNSVSKLLASHFAANFEHSTEDGFWSSFDDTDENYKRKKLQASPRQTQKKKEIPDVRKTCFALVSTENIKLVYLKRSLVEELLKQPESFDTKVVGSFVRVKSNPNDYLQKNSHQLLQVKGVSASSNGHILLQFSNCPEDFPICKLSDDNFTEEECADLRNRMKDGLLKKPTIVELEQKARSLHKDITNHWIPKELALLQKRIDQANEKGWRRELCEYMDRMQLLNDPSEQSRLLNEFPEIIAEPEPAAQDLERDNRDGCPRSPESPVMEAFPEFLDTEWGSGTFSDQSETRDWESQSERSASAYEKLPQQSHIVAPQAGDNILEREHHQPDVDVNGSCRKKLFPDELQEMHLAFTSKGQPIVDIEKQHQPSCNTIGEVKTNLPLDDQETMIENLSTLKVELIVLSNDELEYKVGPTRQSTEDSVTRETRDQINQCKGFAFEGGQKTPNAELVGSSYSKQDCPVKIGHQPVEDVNTPLWYCLSGHGHRAGPFRMSSLKKCFETRDQKLEIKVWKKGEKEEEAIPLEDAIRKLFP